MRNRPFALPVPKSDTITESLEEGNLKNKFAGKIIFRNNLYNLETGNLTVLDKIKNEWFLEELFIYALTNNDQNLIPALKRITADSGLGESERQRASETIELIQERPAIGKGESKIPPGGTVEAKADAARKMLAGIRYPQTTDILRLLREKPAELKRLALYLIGKFNLADMIQEVCECINTPGLETDAVSVLLAFGNSAADELNRYYFISSGNINSSKAILRIYAQCCPKGNMSFLVERLWSNSRELREISLNALVKCGYNSEKDDRERLNKVIFDNFKLLTRIISCKISLHENNNGLLHREMDKEYNRWKEYLLKLMILTHGNVIPVSERKKQSENNSNEEKFVPELAEIIYRQQEKGTISDLANEKKKLKKLHRIFPGEVPRYKELLEDIINSDYNTFSIWTKASAIRAINEIVDESMGESVVALLFSPEEILRQEAARLIARTDKKLYDATSGRISEMTRKSLDEIISGKTDRNGLLYEKVKFLATIFTDINEEELLFLAEKTLFITNKQPVNNLNHMGAVLWSFREGKSDPETAIIFEKTDLIRIVTERIGTSFFFYILPLSDVEEFTVQYPECSFRILKYIDKNEERH